MVMMVAKAKKVKRPRNPGNISRAFHIASEINSTIKSPVLTLGGDPAYKITRIPSGSLAIDRILGGGFALGRHIELYGDECLGVGTKVLTADMNWVNIETLEQNDLIVGFDEFPESGSGKQRRLREAKVIRNKLVVKPSYEIMTSAGTNTIASENHLWLVANDYGNQSKKMVVWKATSDLRIGDNILWFGSPWEELNHSDEIKAAYLAGLFDGEGTTDGSRISLAQVEGDVLDYGIELLEDLGFKVIKREANKSRKENWQVVYGAFVCGGVYEVMKFMGLIKPVRLRGKWDGRAITKKGRYCEKGASKATVIGKKFLGYREVYATKTSTGTLISDGLFSHNSSCKTTICYMTMALSQQRGNLCALIDAENSFDPDWFEHLGGNAEELILSRPKVAEEAIEAMMLLFQKEVEVVGIDSVAALSTKEEINKAPNAETDVRIASQARFMSTNLRRLTTVNDNTLCLWINQNRTKIGTFFGNPTTQPGGRALKFYGTSRVELKRGESIAVKGKKVNTKSRVIDSTVKSGYWVYARAHKNKVSREGMEATFAFDSINNCIDPISEIIQLGLADGIIERTERKFTYVDYDEVAWEGPENKFRQMIAENKVLRKELVECIEDRTLELAHPSSGRNARDEEDDDE
jgi:protein RecA